LFTLLYTAEPSVSTADQPAIVSATACRGTVGVKWLRARSADGRTDRQMDGWSYAVVVGPGMTDTSLLAQRL